MPEQFPAQFDESFFDENDISNVAEDEEVFTDEFGQKKKRKKKSPTLPDPPLTPSKPGAETIEGETKSQEGLVIEPTQEDE